MFNLFSPWKMFNKKFKKRRRSYNVFGPLKKVILFSLGSVFSIMLISALVETVSSNTKGRKAENYLIHSPGEVPEVLRPDNLDGSVNGLNLLLINDIKTEGYIKEYLQIASESEKGSLVGYGEGLPVVNVLGMSLGEQGTYPGTPIPQSLMPVDSNGVPQWDKSSGMTLTELEYSDYTFGGGSVTPYGSSMAGGSDGPDKYWGPFQQTRTYFESFGGSYKAANINPKVSSSRKSDPAYFPDQVAGLNAEYSRFRTNFPNAKVSPEFATVYTSGAHNVGLYGYTSQVAFGTWVSNDNNVELIDYYSEDVITSLQLVLDDMESSYNKHSKVLSSQLVPGAHFKWYGTIFLLESGWNIESSSNAINYFNTNKGTMLQCYNKIYPDRTQSDLDSLINNALKSFVSPNSTAYGRSGGAPAGAHTGFLFKERPEVLSDAYHLSDSPIPITNFMPVETAGHTLATAYGGYSLYGYMIKYAGVDIDPTNPSDYMNNSIPEGEWKPDGNSEWMGQYGIDPKDIGPVRTSLLNEGHKWLGSWYSYEGTLPGKNADGSWSNWATPSGWGSPGLDCSSYIQHIYNTVLKVDISRSTWSQRSSPNTYVISEGDAKIGDLIYYWGPGFDWGHVAMYLGKSNGTDIIMHSSQPGDKIKISTWNGSPEYTIREFRRVKGMD